jgi:hypothetical protein
MRNLPELLAFYNSIDAQLESEWKSFAVDAARREKIERGQKTNDHAYFLLCWGQLEIELDDACREAIRKRFRNPDWPKRRGWDLYNPDDPKISGLRFDERVSLVLDKLAAGGEWKMAMKWYGLRNFIAHGGSYEQRIDLNLVTMEFYKVQSAIAT